MKRIKMLLYGEPGVGKSVFAVHAPKPFFICTDGNYEWLDEFGAKDEAHINVSSWGDMKNAMLDAEKNDYETIVVDLVEDGFKWCEQEYCTRNKIEHVSDQGYGKAYDATRNEFFIALSKLLSLDKHVILLCHGITFTTKDRRGVEHTKYAPSARIPDKVLDMIEGRVRYCLRCYVGAQEESDGTITKKRYLSLVPKENEFGIIRGVDENTIPQDIELDFAKFASIIGVDMNAVTPKKEKKLDKKDVKDVKDVKETTTIQTMDASTPITSDTTSQPNTASVTDMKSKLAALKAKKLELDNATQTPQTPQPVEVKAIDDNKTTVTVNEDAPYVEPNTQVEQAKATSVETTIIPKEDKMAAIKAKLAAMNAAKK